MVALMTFYGLSWAAGGNDIIAIKLHLSINQITYFLRGAVIIGPMIAFIITRRWCISLQRHDEEQAAARLRDRRHHALARGRLQREAPADQRVERPTCSPRATARRSTPPTAAADDNGVAAPGGRRRGANEVRAKLSELMYADNVQKPTAEELDEAHHHAEDEHELQAALEGHPPTATSSTATRRGALRGDTHRAPIKRGPTVGLTESVRRRAPDSAWSRPGRGPRVLCSGRALGPGDAPDRSAARSRSCTPLTTDDVPVAVAVVGLHRAVGAGVLDDVAAQRHGVEPGGVVGAHAGAAVGHVGVALASRPTTARRG